MPGFLKTFKIKALSNGRFGRYIIYAVGEILLVVIGILIALQINNSNEATKEKKLYHSVLRNIANDLKQDTLVVTQAKMYYGARSEIARDILEGKYPREKIKKCFLCKTILSTYLPMQFNDKGYIQFRNFNQQNMGLDTLAIEISQFYTQVNPLVAGFNDEVKENSMDNIKLWRDTQPWFSEMLKGKVNEAYIDYLMTTDYKSKIAYYDGIITGNYVRVLNMYHVQAKYLLEKINEELEDHR